MHFEHPIPISNGRTALVRPLYRQDEVSLGTFFQSLSEATRRRYGPHPFDRETARQLCEAIDTERPDRFVAAVEGDSEEPEIIGYMILTKNIGKSDQKRYGDSVPWATTACLAPVVADAYQSQGIGTPMGEHLLRCARSMGYTHVILMGGVQGTNERAKGFYTKLGFCQVGEFWTNYGEPLLNYDMMRSLISAPGAEEAQCGY